MIAHWVQVVMASLILVITYKSPRLRESGLLDECALQILRCAQDDSEGILSGLRAAKELWRTYWESPEFDSDGDCAIIRKKIEA